MKCHIVLAVLLLACLFMENVAEKSMQEVPEPALNLKKPKKYRKNKVVTKTEDNADPIQMLESDEMAEVGKKDDTDVPQVPVIPQDPCQSKHCGSGRVCQVTEQGMAECVCIPECMPERDPRRKVCSNHNETWNSDCHVYQMRCWCDHGSPLCNNEEFKHLHINYYGECKEMPECKDSELIDFPRRMRDWLFNIMRDMADRSELTPHYMEMEKEAENNMTRRWTNAAIWKWCDLDGHPSDRSVSRHELFPIRAPLMTLEHCIAPFLNSCDVNDDHRITLKEWGKCLELPEDDLEEKCEDIREEQEDQG